MIDQTSAIPKGWKMTFMGDVTEITSSKRIFANEYKTSGIPFFRGKEVTEKFNGNKISTELFISEEKYNELKNNFGVPEVNDILLTSVGTLGNPYLVEKDFKFYFKDGNLTWFRNFKDLLPKFLFYWIISPQGKRILSFAKIGSTQEAYTISKLKELSLALPEIPEQRAIVAVLSSLDAKIDLLREQNIILEELCKTLFTEWFVKFNFPNFNGKMVDSELGKIPENWKIGKFSQVVEIKGGTTPSTNNPDYWDGDISWTSPKDLSNTNEIFLLKTEKKITQEGLNQIGSGLLPKGTLLLSSRAPIGYLALSELDISINQGYIAFIPGQYFSNYFMFLWLKVYMPLVISAANGSTFLEISKSSFRNIDTIIPDSTTLEKFDEIIVPFFEKIRLNIHQVQNLKSIRDVLLPKLLNGELRVKGFDKS